MKLKEINMPRTRVYQPITFELTVETLEEARLLYHVVNRSDLLYALQSDPRGYGFDDYDPDIAPSFGLDNAWDEVRKAIERQGFRL